PGEASSRGAACSAQRRVARDHRRRARFSCPVLGHGRGGEHFCVAWDGSPFPRLGSAFRLPDRHGRGDDLSIPRDPVKSGCRRALRCDRSAGPLDVIAASPPRPTARAATGPPPSLAPRAQPSRAWRQFIRHQLAFAGLVVLIALCLLALVAPLSPYDPNRTDL